MTLIEVPSGLEGVIAFHTQVAEPDREGGALRYRGVDIEDLVGDVPFEHVWGLLVDNAYEPGLPPAEPHPLAVRTGDPRVDLQSALAMLAPEWGLRQLIDIDDAQARADLARVSVMALSFVAQSARGVGRPPIPQREIDRALSISRCGIGGRPLPRADWATNESAMTDARARSSRACSSEMSMSCLKPHSGASIASAAWRSTRGCPVRTASGCGSAGGSPGS